MPFSHRFRRPPHIRHPNRRPPDVLVAGAALIGTAWLVGSVGVRLARLTPNPRHEPAPPAVPLTLVAADDSAIAATFWPGPRDDSPAVLIVPGIGALHRRLAPNAAWLARRGYAVLAIDLRGHGRSGPALHSFGWHESADVHAAFAWLKTRQNGAKIAVIGISMGGAAALLGPAGPVAADALVLQAVFPTIRQAVRSRLALIFGQPIARVLEPLLSFQSRPRFGIWPADLAPAAVLPKVDAPVLLIGGARDPFVPPAEVFAFHAAARDARGVWIADGLGHNAISNIQSEPYRRRLRAFFRETIGD